MNFFIPYIIFTLLFIVTSLALVVALGTMIGSLWGNAPYVPTPERAIKKMLELATFKDGETLFDLGSGDGRIVTFATRHFKAHGVGIEQSEILVLLSRLRAKLLHVADRTTFIRGNFFKLDLSKADLVTMYLLPVTNKRMEEKLMHELKPGSRVVSRHFTFPNWKPTTIDVDEKLYLYTK